MSPILLAGKTMQLESLQIAGSTREERQRWMGYEAEKVQNRLKTMGAALAFGRRESVNNVMSVPVLGSR